MNAHTSRCLVVTGASRGIGEQTARMLIERGHSIIGLARNPPAALPGLHHIDVDLACLESTVIAIQQVLQAHPVDALICCAGRGDIGSLENFSAEQIEASLQLNLISPLVLARHVLPILRQRTRSDLIFVGSESALQGGRYGSVYSAAKFGLRGVAQALRQECAGANCHVGIVNPGMVRTDFFNGLNFEPGPEAAHALQPEDVATAILSMIEAADNAVIDEITLNPLQKVVVKKTAKCNSCK